VAGTAADTRRQDAAHRAEADARREAAQRRRAEAEGNNRSGEARAVHPPDEHAADEHQERSDHDHRA
jgi:hypothetical protein